MTDVPTAERMPPGELVLGVPAQGQPLEAVARPLSAGAPLTKAAYSPGMLPSGTGTSAAA
jgi:hypothetical protein